jgi:hypothetical protein
MEASTKRREATYEEVPPTTCEPLRHPLRVRILEVVNCRDISPVQFVDEGLAPAGLHFRSRQNELSHVAYHFRELEKAGCIEMVDTRQVRGATQHFYRGTATVFYDDDEFAALPVEQRRMLSRTTFQGLIARVDGAMRTDTFDKRPDRCLAWLPLELDQRGWKEVSTALGAVYAEVEQIRKDSEARLSEGTEDPIPATVALLGFESPPPPLPAGS